MADTTARAHSVLVVEDEAMVAADLEDTLAQAGFEVATVGNFDDAMATLAAQTFSALVTDINLDSSGSPHGWQIARRVREINPALAVVYITGASAEAWSAQGVPRSLLLQKPFAPAQLVTAVASQINEAQSPPQGR
jgi:DNA-binding NtrC family response regulator